MGQQTVLDFFCQNGHLCINRCRYRCAKEKARLMDRTSKYVLMRERKHLSLNHRVKADLSSEVMQVNDHIAERSALCVYFRCLFKETKKKEADIFIFAVVFMIKLKTHI